MYFFGINGNIEAVWGNQIFLLFNELSEFVVELPGKLYDSGPVVCVGDWRVVVLRKSGGFSVENEVHSENLRGLKLVGFVAFDGRLFWKFSTIGYCGLKIAD